MVPKGSFFNDVDTMRYLGTGKYLSESLHLGEHGENMLCTEIVLNVKKKSVYNMLVSCSELGIHIVDAKIRASDKDLPVRLLQWTMNLKSFEIRTYVLEI